MRHWIYDALTGLFIVTETGQRIDTDRLPAAVNSISQISSPLFVPPHSPNLLSSVKLNVPELPPLILY